MLSFMLYGLSKQMIEGFWLGANLRSELCPNQPAWGLALSDGVCFKGKVFMKSQREFPQTWRDFLD